VLTIVARRWFAFAGPAAFWVLAAVVAVVDWRVLSFPVSIFPVAMAAAFMLGNLRVAIRAFIGLALVLASAGILVSVIPGHSIAALVFIPVEFATLWLAGFALRETAGQAEAAEERATLAEQEREAQGRAVVAMSPSSGSRL